MAAPPSLPRVKKPVSLEEIEKMTEDEILRFRLSGMSKQKVKQLYNQPGISYIVAKRQVIKENFIKAKKLEGKPLIINSYNKSSDLEAVNYATSSSETVITVPNDGKLKTKMELELNVAYGDRVLNAYERSPIGNQQALHGNDSIFRTEQSTLKKRKLDSKEQFSFMGERAERIGLVNDQYLSFHFQSERSGVEFSFLDQDERIIRDNQLHLSTGTTHQTGQSYMFAMKSEANNDFFCDTEPINVALVPEGYPRIHLNSGRLTAIQNAILAEYDKLTRDGPQIRLGKCTHELGFLLIYCYDEVTIEWLRKIVPSLTPREDAVLKVFVGNDIPRPLACKVFVPNENNRKLACDKILHRLQLGNKSLNTKLWVVSSYSPAENGQFWTFIIDKDSLDELKLLGMCPYFGFGRLKFRIDETAFEKKSSEMVLSSVQNAAFYRRRKEERKKEKIAAGTWLEKKPKKT